VRELGYLERPRKSDPAAGRYRRVKVVLSDVALRQGDSLVNTRTPSKRSLSCHRRAAYRKDDLESRENKWQSHPRDGQLYWTQLLQMFQDHRFQSSVTHSQLFPSPQFHAICCHLSTSDEKEVAGSFRNPDDGSRGWGNLVIRAARETVDTLSDQSRRRPMIMRSAGWLFHLDLRRCEKEAKEVKKTASLRRI
jgi:hypothetical protein